MRSNDTLNLRPKFHITGEKGWINDPNGLIFFQNKYHAFFQYYPHDVHWGPMHWGHVISEDLTHWNRLPIGLYPGGDGEENGCFSGSAIVWQDKLWVLYTGFTENQGGESIRQLQCLASSEDGVHFKKHGVVIGEKDLPEGYCPWDFRDPKVWRHNDTFWCVVAVRSSTGKGRIVLYKSKDLFSWSFVGDLFGEDCPGHMIECPDYNEELGLLVYCEQFQPNEGKLHLNVHSSRWHIGRLDYERGKFISERQGIVDYGFDFYAPQSFNQENIMMAWLNMWDRNVPSEKYGFAGMLTVPRRFSVVNGELYQTPICQGKEVVCQQVQSSYCDKVKHGIVKISADNLRGMTLYMRKKGEKYAKFSLENGEWIFNRANAGERIEGVEKDEDSIAGMRRMPFSKKERTEITIVFDEFSIEIFENGKSLSATVYPELDAEDLELFIDADNCTYKREEIL